MAFVFNKNPLLLAGKLKFENIVLIYQQFMKDPESVIHKNYKPAMIFSPFYRTIDSLHSEILALRQENERLKTMGGSAAASSESANESQLVKQLKESIRLLKEPKDSFKTFENSEYSYEGDLGKGAQAVVTKVSKSEKKYYAKKEFVSSQLNSDELRYFINESEVLFALQHPCIIQIHGFNSGDEHNPPSMILSLEKQSLEDAIRNNSLNNITKSQVAVEIAIGMQFVHSRKYIHRDLKPSNILLSEDNHARISDFGLTREISFQESLTIGVGTLRFMAPELMCDDNADYTNSIDVYAFGIILFFIVVGNYPPYNMKNLMAGILPPMPSSIAEWVKDLITSCLSIEGKDRPTFAGILDIMKSHNYNLFSDETTLSSIGKAILQSIQQRINTIRAYEFQI